MQLSQLSPEFQPVVGFYKELRQAIGITGETAARVRKLLAGLERSPGRRTESALLETSEADSAPTRKVSGVGQLLSIAAQMFLT